MREVPGGDFPGTVGKLPTYRKRDQPLRFHTRRRNVRSDRKIMTVPYNPQNPPNPPPDREERVEVVNRPGAYSQRRVVRYTAAEQRLIIMRIVQVLWLLFGFLEALIGIRIVLKLIGANPAAFFSIIIYGITDVFLWPFAGLIPNPGTGAFVLEVTSIIGMIVYALIALGLTRLIWVLFYHPDTSEVSVYREERQ